MLAAEFVVSTAGFDDLVGLFCPEAFQVRFQTVHCYNARIIPASQHQFRVQALGFRVPQP